MIRPGNCELLGNRPTMTGDFIPKVLHKNYNIETIIPESYSLDKAHYFVSKELTQGVFSNEAREFFVAQIKHLIEKGAEGIILGCTELPLLIDQNDVDIPVLPTTDLHVKMGVDFIFSS